MALRRHHYERAFEAYLHRRCIPYVAVDDARRALLPPAAHALRLAGQPARISPVVDAPAREGVLKSFDFVVYGHDPLRRARNLLLEVKGRRIAPRKQGASGGPARPATRARLENWVTHDDITSLRAWGELFGEGFVPGFVFVYWCQEQPPDALFQEVFAYQGRWYALRGVLLADYCAAMKVRSPRWRTLDMPAGAFERLSQTVGPTWLGSAG